MREYELTVLIHPDFEINQDPAVNKIQKIITDNGGEITKDEDEGKKRLAYQIQKQDFAIYHYFELKLPPEALAKISATLNITNEVLRYLLVAKDEKRALAKQQKEAKEQQQDEEEEKS
ncbi:MAG: 30S ribosomal protein S6 [Candidatus Nomurabacteria bacterium]|jgi:small subunit ribosomal protein S6|nr:30S ribosomal protein S6 [Candidatus Nomurabacteria bacterium]